MKKISVCWYCEKWQPGGIQALQVRLLEHMDLSRFQVDIVVSEDDTSLFDEALERLGVQKIVTLQKGCDQPGKRVFRNIFAVKQLLKTKNYDVVHFNVCHGVELIYVFAAWLCQIPVRIVHCRNNDIGAGGRSRAIKVLCHRICKVLFQWCGTVKLANSDLAASWLYTKGDLKRQEVKILRNGIDAEKFRFDAIVRDHIRQSLGLQEDAFVVGHIGHFSYQKNHEYLLQIFAEIRRKKENAWLLLTGEGELQKEIRKQAEQLGILDRVIFYGVTNQVGEVLAAMDVFVLPSRFEGFGNVLIEAQASGLPCYASAEVIPESVNLTDLMTRLPLEAGATRWADAVVNGTMVQDRSRYEQIIRDCGYDIQSMADTLQQYYLGVSPK